MKLLYVKTQGKFKAGIRSGHRALLDFVIAVPDAPDLMCLDLMYNPGILWFLRKEYDLDNIDEMTITSCIPVEAKAIQVGGNCIITRNPKEKK